MSANYPRIRSLHFDRHERPVRAVVVTQYGIVRAEWLEVAGDRCWFASGTGDAKREAVLAIEHIEQMCQSMR
ncbi:MAG: hypothetical protein WCS65_12640 [Verrucomicrobiae bacterium]